MKYPSFRSSVSLLNKKWLRYSIAPLIIIAWFAIAGIGGPTFGKLSSVSTEGQVAFLPASAQSTRVQDLQSKFQSSQSIPAIIVIESQSDIQPSSLESYQALIKKIQSVEGVQAQANTQASSIIGPIPSEDKRAVELIVPISEAENLKSIIPEIREAIKGELPSGQTAYITGPAGLSADLVKAFGGIDGLLLLVALGAVFVILLLVYRSIALPFLVLLNAVFALCGSILLVYFMAKWGWIELNGQSQGILSILVIGAATDYSLLLVARYRESLQSITHKWDALKHAFKVSFEPILASGLTVIIALLCLLFSDLNSNKSLGPIAATGIVFSLLTTLSFLPALLLLFGRGAFWPRTPKHVVLKNPFTNRNPIIWEKVGNIVSHRPRATWIVTGVLLIAAGSGILQLKATGVPQSDLILSQSEAVDGQAVLQKHFDSSIATPMVVIAPQAMQDAVTAALVSLDNVENAAAYSGTPASRPGSPAAPAKVVDGKVLLNVTLATDQADSDEAEAVVKNARTKLAAIDPSILVGGTTAIALDTNQTAQDDLIKIIPIVLLVILLILIALLRSIIAPVLLIVSVIVSYAAALGISALVFNHVFGFPGADAAVPLFGFVFLVALGVDYNIFLMSRVREESKKHGTKKGIIIGLSKTGGVITSAGIVLAATFAALGIIPILFLAQIAFIVAFGVLLDTIIVRSLLVPALAYDIGKYIWWPSKLWRDGKK
ncbi:MMPL family transporter [bacterium]|nr:MAG: MMPL family transporter [bacterium]